MARILSANIRNFRCLHEVDIDFEPLTVLVGHNASGKSSVITALRADVEWDHQDVALRRAKKNVSVSVTQHGRPEWTRSLPPSGRSGRPPFVQ